MKHVFGVVFLGIGFNINSHEGIGHPLGFSIVAGVVVGILLCLADGRTLLILIGVFDDLEGELIGGLTPLLGVYEGRGVFVSGLHD